MNIASSFVKKYFAHFAGLPLSCWQRIGLAFINDTAGGVCFFLSIYFVNVLHINIVTAGIIISSYGIGTAVGGILGGKLSDKMSPEIVSVTSIFIKAIAFLFLLKLTTITLLIINQFILGVTTYAFITANNVWVLNNCKADENIKLKTLSMLYAASNLGLGLSAIVVSVLSHYGFHYVFFLSSILLFLAAIYLTLKKDKQIAFKNKTQATIATTESNFKKENRRISSLVLICLFLIGLIIAQLSTTYPIYVRNAFPELGINAVGILFTLNSLLIVVFQTPIVNFFSEYNKIMMVGFGIFLMGFGMFLLSFSVVFVIAILSCVLYTMGEMLFFSMAQLVIYETSENQNKGQSLGMFQTIFATSVIIGPTVGSFIYYHAGSNILWYLSGVVGISCLAACYYNKNWITA